LRKKNPSEKEWVEFLKIKNEFPNARIKKDYNREILDIGAEISEGNETFILLKGPQTNDLYELITPACHCVEGLATLDEVRTALSKLCQSIEPD
jgi:hypothetical protein